MMEQTAERRGSAAPPLPSPEQARAAFERRYPACAATRALDDLRATDYARLDRQAHVYLDYTGGGLYAERQLRAHLALLTEQVLGNPHSDNPTSRAATELDERARAAVLDYFNASPDEYVAIFTPNASGALRLVGESYPFGPQSHFALTFDNHNSVNGIREFAHARGATVTYLPVALPDLRADEERLFACLDGPAGDGPRLFAYPAQSNFSGVQHPLEWIAHAHERGWDVLLDAAAFAPTNRLDLGRWHPDFVPLSFYKLFGYPTGVGCLIARREALAKLRRPWFAGGTIWAVSVATDRVFMADDEAAFEDGTIDYLALPAVEIGLQHLRAIGIDLIHTRVECLTGWLLDQLATMRHGGGAPAVQIYGPPECRGRGATIAFNFLDPAGRIVDERLVGRRATARRISLRTGCFCNPGAGEVALAVSHPVQVDAMEQEQRPPFDDLLRMLGLQSGGAVRVSLGLVTTFADVYHFAAFARTFIDEYPDLSDLSPRLHC
jgi:selenocysteine lyase/cysteine desulfurase